MAAKRRKKSFLSAWQYHTPIGARTVVFAFEFLCLFAAKKSDDRSVVHALLGLRFNDLNSLVNKRWLQRQVRSLRAQKKCHVRRDTFSCAPADERATTGDDYFSSGIRMP
jgi:hypothetical protein